MTERLALVFIALAACSAPAPPSRRPPPIVHTAPPADAAIDAPPPPAIGEACRDRCGAHACLPWAGGYCSDRCEDACEAGTCVATPGLGGVCAQTCESDRDCRWDDGYVCDATWHACLLPNTAAIVPKRCPPAKGASHDDVFAAPEPLSPVDLPASHSPVAVVVGTGIEVAFAVADGGIALDPGHAIVRRRGSEPALALDGNDTRGVWVKDGERPTLEIEELRVVDTREAQDVPGPTATGLEGADCDADRSCPARPRLAVSRKPHAVYLAYSGDVIGTRVRASSDGKTFDAGVTALTGARGDLATSDDGRVHVIAMRGGLGGAYGAAQHVLEYTVSKDGGKSFAKAVTVSARDELIPAYFANPTLAVDDKRGWLYVAYVRGGTDAVWDVVIAASKDKGATWTRTTIGDGCAIHMLPAIAVDPTTGTLHVTYYDSRADIGRYVHASCGAGATKCGERGTIERVPFAALGTDRLDAAWLGDREALVVDDTRRELHAVWTQPVAEQGRTVARVFHAVAKLPRR